MAPTTSIGVDLIRCYRFRCFQHRSAPSTFLDVRFCPGELAAARSHRKPSVALAACFAAKEPFRFNLTGSIRLIDLDVMYDATDRPVLLMHGEAARAFAQHGGGVVHVSLGVIAPHALTTVVWECGDDPAA